MRYIGIIILLVLCLTLLSFTGCTINTAKPETPSGNLENQEATEEPVIVDTEEPVIVDTEEPGTIYPQQWATGEGTVGDPWTNNCIKKALDFVPAGGTIFLRAGYYQLTGDLTIAKEINIIGEGMNKTIILTADAHGFTLYKSGGTIEHVTIKNLTIDGDAQTEGGSSTCISVKLSNDILLENIEAKNAGRYGIDTNQMNYSTLLNIYAHDNWRHGVHSGADVSGQNIHNTYVNIYSWDNGAGDGEGSGFDDRGNSPYPDEDSYNIYNNLQCWDNAGAGISIFDQHNGIISNSFANGNGSGGKYGLNFWGLDDFNINNCSVALNEGIGIRIKDSNDVNFTNVISKNNNVNDGEWECGIEIDGCNGIRFTSCQSYDDRDTPLQAYGIELIGVNMNINLVSCKLSPNKEGEIYNPAGVILKVITEKGGVSPSVIVRE